MAAERIPNAKPEAEKPGSSAAAAGAAKGGGALRAWLPLIITVAVMPLLAYGVTSFVIVPKLQKSLGLVPAQPEHATEAGGQAEAATQGGGGHGGGEAATGGGGTTVSMTKLLVNVNGTMGSRYLLSSYVISGKGADFQAKFEKNNPKLIDVAGTLLSSKSISDLEKPNARNLIKSELTSAFNTVLGNNAVQDISITEFAIQ